MFRARSLHLDRDSAANRRVEREVIVTKPALSARRSKHLYRRLPIPLQPCGLQCGSWPAHDGESPALSGQRRYQVAVLESAKRRASASLGGGVGIPGRETELPSSVPIASENRFLYYTAVVRRKPGGLRRSFERWRILQMLPILTKAEVQADVGFPVRDRCFEVRQRDGNPHEFGSTGARTAILRPLPGVCGSNMQRGGGTAPGVAYFAAWDYGNGHFGANRSVVHGVARRARRIGAMSLRQCCRARAVQRATI